MKAKSKLEIVVDVVLTLMIAVPVLIAWFKVVVILWRWAVG